MQEETKAPAPSLSDKVLSTAVIWRLAQIVLVLAVAYLYLYFGSFAGSLQQMRLFAEPHLNLLVRLAVVGLVMGTCLGLALKDFTKGRAVVSFDWPILLFNLIASGIFIIVAVSLQFSALSGVTYIHGLLPAAVTQEPLLPFIWFGLTLTTIVQPRQV